MTEPKTGDFCKFYVDTGTSTTPTWTEVGEIDGVECSDLTRNSVEMNVRCLAATPSLPGKIQALTFTFKYFPGFNDTTYQQFRTDFFTPAIRKYAMMDGDITTNGSQGLTMPCYVEGIPYHQAAGDVVNHDVTLKYAYKKETSGSTETVLQPTWMSVSSST